MDQLEVRFTLKGEQNEKTFFLRNEEDKFYLIGDSADSKRYEVQKDEFTNIFKLKDKGNFATCRGYRRTNDWAFRKLDRSTVARFGGRQ